MTLQALRTAVGKPVFFNILRTWAATKKYGDATTAQFIALAESKSGKQLDALFTTWLYTKGKPAVGPNGRAAATAGAEPKSYQQIKQTHALLAAHGG